MTEAILGRLPDVIIIGAMKAGTTSLHAYLDKHPDIFMSEIKELNFFDEKTNWSKGMNWYKSNFITNKAVAGESSPSYSKRHTNQGTAKKIKDNIPNAKIVYILRDPIQRIVSHIAEYYYQGGVKKEINKVFREKYQNGTLQDMHIVRTSMYYYQLEEYLKYFDAEQIHFLTLEELKENRLKTMNQLFDFIGVSHLQDDASFNFSANTSANKKMYNSLANKIRHSKLKEVFRKIMPRATYFKLINSRIGKTISKTRIDPIPLTAESEKYLKEVLYKDVEHLKSFTKKEFTEWKQYDQAT